MKKTVAIAIVCMLVLSGCARPSGKAYYNRGDPENLITVSSEMVTVGLTSKESLDKLATILTEDPPASAVLMNCEPVGDTLCQQAKAIVDKHKIASRWSGDGNSKAVTLLYQRIEARDCENRYINNTRNQSNLNHPTFGCSVTGNTVQMVSDKHQFANPNLLDFQDGAKAQQNYDGYMAPPVGPQQGGAVTNFMINSGAVSGTQ